MNLEIIYFSDQMQPMPGQIPNRNQQWRQNVPAQMNQWPNQNQMPNNQMGNNPYQNTHVRQHLNTLISNRQTPMPGMQPGYPPGQGYPQNSMPQGYRTNGPVNQASLPQTLLML